MDIVERLRHAATTASNDDLSSLGTEKRRRHAERFDAMLAGADEIEKLRTALRRIGSLDAKNVPK